MQAESPSVMSSSAAIRAAGAGAGRAKRSVSGSVSGTAADQRSLWRPSTGCSFRPSPGSCAGTVRPPGLSGPHCSSLPPRGSGQVSLMHHRCPRGLLRGLIPPTTSTLPRVTARRDLIATSLTLDVRALALEPPVAQVMCRPAVALNPHPTREVMRNTGFRSPSLSWKDVSGTNTASWSRHSVAVVAFLARLVP